MSDTRKALETFLQSVQFGMMVVGEDRRIIMVNQAALHMMGYQSQEDITGKTCHQLVCPAEEGKCPILDLGQRVDFSEKILLCKSGVRLPILKSVSRINLDGKTVLLETFIDISERLSAEKEAEDARAFIQAVMESVAEPIMVIGLDYRVRMMNMTARRFGHFRDGTLSNPPMCYEVSHHRDTPCSMAKGHPCPLEQVKETGEPVLAVHEHMTADGEGRYFEILASPLRDSSGALEAIIETSRDITDRVNMERQRTDFLAMVTHDLKSPLTVIMGYTEMMLDSKMLSADPQAEEMLDGIYHSGKKLYRLVEDFLAISKLEKAGSAVSMTLTDVASLIRETSVEAVSLASNAAVEFHMEVGTLPKAMLDKRLVQRAVWNLLENAIKFTPEGGSVTLKAEALPQGSADRIVISVADTGIGISQSDKKKIFDKYYRSPKTAGIKGTGLGLAIVKAVADAHSGIVELESEPGKGSVFRLVLPLRSDILEAD